MTAKKSILKKGLLMLMAVITVLGAFINIPDTLPEAEAATAGSYRVTLTVETYNSVDVGNNKDLDITFYYKTNNGKGTAKTLAKTASYRWAQDKGTNNLVVDLAGFPTAVNVHCRYAWTAAIKRKWGVNLSLSVLNKNKNENFPLAKQKFEKSGNSGGQTEMDYKMDITTGTPYVDRIEWDNSAQYVTVPKTGTASVTTGKATVYDQYGVTWYQAPMYALNSSNIASLQTADITGITRTNTNSDTCTVSVTSAARDYVGANNTSKPVYLNAYLNGQRSSIKTITVNNVGYNVIFKNYDGTVIEQKSWTYGSTPTCSKTPTRENTAEYTYKFTGWSPAVTAANGDIIYTAQYSATKNKYNITFKNGDGSNLQSSMWEYGTTPSCSKTPTKASDGIYTYTFSGWSPVIKTVTGAATYTPQFSRTPVNFTVSFNANGGTGSMASFTINYEETKTLPLNTFTKTGYTFMGWAVSAGGGVQYSDGAGISKIKNNLTLYAVWQANTYTIKTILHNNKGSEAITAKYDQDINIPDPVKKGFVFNGWSDAEQGTIKYAPGAKVRNLAVSGEVILHAVWTFDASAAGVKLTSQSIVLDFGLPVEYDIKANNTLNGAKLEYLGTADAAYENSLSLPSFGGLTENTAHGIFTMTKDGNVRYEMKDMNFNRSDTVYVVARITGDASYETGTVYYAYEKITFVPATSIYYEDSFSNQTVIKYTDGKGSDKYGKWQTEGTELADMKQAADLAGDPNANIYGHDDAYKNCTTFSAGSAHYVKVSDKNNPRKNSGAGWPVAEFTFTGTGFDLISITNNLTGAVEVRVLDAQGKRVKNYIVDTYYGYKYGQIYMDENGNPTLTPNNKPMYKSLACEAFTATPTYYVSAEDKTLTADKTPYPAYAFGWVLNPDADETLYQIPVIKSDKLPYGKYKVEIIPTFTKMFGHSSTDGDAFYYGFCLDAIRIYNPVNPDDKEANDAYDKDKESDPGCMEVRDLIIAANSFGDAGTDGMIFIDGAPVTDNIELYKNAGPKNELYLKKGQAIAFNLVSDKVPADVHIGAKLIKGMPQLTFTEGSNAGSQSITTATDMYYSFRKLLSSGKGLEWTKTADAEGKTVYKTQTITIQNNSEADSVLSLTNIKYTFETPELKPMMFRAMASPMTAKAALSSVNMLKADLTVNKASEPTVENGAAVFVLTTSTEVSSLIIRDNKGNAVIPLNVESTVKTADGREYKEWKVSLDASEPGTFTYEVYGAYENGYSDTSKAVKISFTSDAPENNSSFLENLLNLLKRIKAYFDKLFEIFRFTK